MTYDDLAATGLFEIRAPRYTSYPPATAFQPATDARNYSAALAALDPDAPISVYIHIPFCERLCWFCACRTQGVRSQSPVTAYVDVLISEIEKKATLLPTRMKIGALHWGGGTPTILPPDQITKLIAAIDTHFDRANDFTFAVEIDPTLVDAAKIDALASGGMTRASIGIQDFNTEVQRAIGREQSFEQTRDVVEQLRNAGINSLNLDIVYGLPKQSSGSFGKTLTDVLKLKADRISLFGYAHVPHMAKRQRLISEFDLPDDRKRYALFERAKAAFTDAGYQSIGIDHFALPDDTLAIAARTGHLRRNFQGYTDDTCATLLGFGASAITKANGYFQNSAATTTYSKLVQTGLSPVAREHVMQGDDPLRGRMIEMLLSDFRIDLNQLVQEGLDAAKARALIINCMASVRDHVTFDEAQNALLVITKPIVRAIAQTLDAYAIEDVVYSRVS